MTAQTEPRRITDLLTLLKELAALHERLVGLIQEKIDAMRHADTQRMRQVNEEERSLARRIDEREGLRRQLTDLIGKAVGLPPRGPADGGGARGMSAAQLASRLPAAQREQILGAAVTLRAAVAQVTRLNHVAGTISGEILNHLRWVGAAVRSKHDKMAGYAGDGAPVGPAGTRIFDAVG